MTRVIPYFLVFMFPGLVALGVELGGLWTVLPVLVTFMLVPLLDELVPKDTDNPDESATKGKADPKRWIFDVPLLLWVPAQLAMQVYVLIRVGTGFESFTALELVGITLSTGVIAGAGGINIAHELMHRKGKLHRASAEILMTSVSYTHFCVEHILGHHRMVATPEDAASSRRGESIYRFYPRTVSHSLVSAWRLETQRCAKKGIPFYSPKDRRTRYLLVLAAVYAGVGLALGPLALGVFVAQGVVAFSLLEAINYIEHYGLARKRLDNGRYERVRPEHSWNSPHRVSNWYLFNLARHSDHHYLASREYDRLRHYDEVPQLPTGYAGMVLMALLPPLYFKVMDPLVDAWNGRGETLAPASAQTGEEARPAA